MPILIRLLFRLLRNLRAILAVVVLIIDTGFSGKIFVQEVSESIFSHWLLIALVCVVVIAREFLRGYFEIRRTETLAGIGIRKANDEL